MSKQISCNSKLLYNVINKFKPDKIVHFAAESHVDRSIDGPMTFVNTNLVGTATLLDVQTILLKNNLLNLNKTSR